MKILYLHRLPLHIYPPCITQILSLKELEIDVVVGYGDCDEKVVRLLEEKGIICESLNISRKRKDMFSKIESCLVYRKRAVEFLKKNYADGDIIWFGSADSCFLLGKKLEKYRFGLSVLELYDNNKLYLKGISKVIHKAKFIVACEENRAAIMRSWWKLKNTPYIMPNKPYSHILKKYAEGSIDETRKMINKIDLKSKNILYQGIISADRDLGILAQVLNDLKMDINLYIMGPGKPQEIECLIKKYPKTFYLGSAPAPYHLEVTSYASIGVAIYDYSCLNNCYCAPNKIYEYTGFGIPVLANDVPGLKNTIEKYNAGICVDFNNKTEVGAAIIDLIKNYEYYSKNAIKFYNCVDNIKTVRNIVDSIKCEN